MTRCGILLFSLLFTIPRMQGEVLHQPANQQQLRVLSKQAEELRAKNLNRFGLEQLKNYDNLLNSLYAKEKNDTLKALARADERQNTAGQNHFRELVKQKESLLTDQALLDQRYTTLLTRTGLLILLLTLIATAVVLTWQFRLKRLRRESVLFEARKNKAILLTSAGEQLIKRARLDKQSFGEFQKGLDEIQRRIDQLQQIRVNENGMGMWKEALVHTKKINTLLQQETERNEALVQFANSDSDEKVTMDINRLCTRYFDLVQDGFQTGENITPVKATRDLEKNLPGIPVVPAAIGHLLIHVLTNAMQSVQAKAAEKVKGYEPRVSLSTRILPRFLQIRVHDNGDGIDDRIMPKIRDAFFTLKPDETGLGLYICERIMKNHKGELKIESERNRGTDVYLRFFLN